MHSKDLTGINVEGHIKIAKMVVNHIKQLENEK
jgi:hypothetical protein